MPGMPLQVICYERADDLGFGVSGVVTRARGIRESFPDLDPADIPMAHPVNGERSSTCWIRSGPAVGRGRSRPWTPRSRPFRGPDHALELPSSPSS